MIYFKEDDLELSDEIKKQITISRKSLFLKWFLKMKLKWNFYEFRNLLGSQSGFTTRKLPKGIASRIVKKVKLVAKRGLD